MIAVSFAWFFLMLTLAMGLVTFVQSTWPDSVVGRAFGVIY